MFDERGRSGVKLRSTEQFWYASDDQAMTTKQGSWQQQTRQARSEPPVKMGRGAVALPPAQRTGGPPLHPAGGGEHVDDLTELIDRTIDVLPAASDPQVGLVDLPAIPDAVQARPSGVGQQRREPLHPAVDGDVVDLDTPLGEGVPRRRGRTARSAGTSGPQQRSPRVGSGSRRRRSAAGPTGAMAD
jgi:hypothetical protein